jgi:hypothetical protein
MNASSALSAIKRHFAFDDHRVGYLYVKPLQGVDIFGAM